MRALTLLALLGLGASAYFAPRHFEARGEERFIDEDGAAMLRLGEGPEKALGTGYAGARKKKDLLKRFDFAFRLWAAAPSQPKLPQMVRLEVKSYLEEREKIDPDGAVVRDVLDAWLSVRMESENFLIQLGPAVWLASCGDERGVARLWKFVRDGPFFSVHFPHIRRGPHPQWSSVRPLVEHYLEKGKLDARVQAGVLLLDYASLWGLGAELVKQHRAEILRDLKASITTLKTRIVIEGEPHAVLSGLAMLGEEGAAVLRVMPEIKVDENVDLLRIARMWAGIDSFSRIPVGSLKWRLLDPDAQSFYLQAATHRFLRLARAARKEPESPELPELPELTEVRKIAESGVESADTNDAWTCITGLMALGEPYRTDLAKRARITGGAHAILMACAVPLDGVFAVLLHGAASPDPLYAGLSAANLRRVSGPLPLQGPVGP